MHDALFNFAEESNAIEGIHDITASSVMAERLEVLLYKPVLTMEDVISFAKMCGGELRDKVGMDVRVGAHIPPPGGAEIQPRLEKLLSRADAGIDPYHVHCKFETLHPFTDGNGRTGRMLWAWMMIDQSDYDLSLKFLHKFYYQTLDHYRK
jgi:hypothetical protein